MRSWRTEVRDHEREVAPPTHIMMGCQAWPPKAVKGERCPVCKNGIMSEDHGLFCGWDESVSPAKEAQVRAARLGINGKERATQAEKKAKELQRKQTVRLSEAERRRVFVGCKSKSPLGDLGSTGIVNASKAGRDWLRQVGQLPDWSKILDSHGNTIGYRELEPDEEEQPE